MSGTASKYFMIFRPAGVSQGGDYLGKLRRIFEEKNVYPLDGGGAFVVRTPGDDGYHSVMKKLGFNKEKRQPGVLMRFDSDNINGWHSQALWSFIREG